MDVNKIIGILNENYLKEIEDSEGEESQEN